jgi:HD-GYP domain-containing protein (c-di-GMP phosphodiesterase class II)
MTSARPYKATLTTEEAITEIKKCAGTQFDPKLVKIFCEIIDQNGYSSDANN